MILLSLLYNYYYKEETEQNSFKVFPEEIIVNEIFPHLSLDLPNLALVSRDFKRLADHPNLYKKIYPPAAVGVTKLHEYLPDDPRQKLEQEASLPRRVYKDLAEGRYIEDGKEKQKYMLTWVDEKFSGKDLSLLYIHELVSNPKKGNQTRFDAASWQNPIITERKIEKAHWCLLPKGNIPGSKFKTRDQKLKIIEEQRKKIPGLYLNSDRDTAFSIFMNYVINGEKCFSDESTMINEQTNNCSVAIGHFSGAGLVVDFSYGPSRDGVAGAWKFFGN